MQCSAVQCSTMQYSRGKSRSGQGKETTVSPLKVKSSLRLPDSVVRPSLVRSSSAPHKPVSEWGLDLEISAGAKAAGRRVIRKPSYPPTSLPYRAYSTNYSTMPIVPIHHQCCSPLPWHAPPYLFKAPLELPHPSKAMPRLILSRNPPKHAA